MIRYFAKCQSIFVFAFCVGSFVLCNGVDLPGQPTGQPLKPATVRTTSAFDPGNTGLSQAALARKLGDDKTSAKPEQASALGVKPSPRPAVDKARPGPSETGKNGGMTIGQWVRHARNTAEAA